MGYFKYFTVFVAMAGFFTMAAATPLSGAGNEIAMRDRAEQPPPGISCEWWNTVRETVHRSEYEISRRDETPVPGFKAAWQAYNRAQNLRLFFAETGIRAVPRGSEAPEWMWGMSLEGYGYAGNIRRLGGNPPKLEITGGNRAEYQWSGLTEWYVNDERGLEQGFTLSEPPALQSAAPERGTPRRSRDEPLVIEMALSGNLEARLNPSGNVIDFFTPAGENVIRYGNLHVYDASGRELDSGFDLKNTGVQGPLADTLSIRIDVAGAKWPITVDPLVTSPSWSYESGQANANLGCSVATAGDVNGDGYSDIIVGADGFGAGGEGRIFVFYGSATGPVTGTVWTYDGAQAGENLGHSVCTAGDINGDGFSDIIAGADSRDNGGDADAGQVYVFFGTAGGLSITPDWTYGIAMANANLGSSVHTAGDVNNDGFSDVIVGASGYGNGQTGEGAVFVFYGSGAGLGAGPDWDFESDLAGANLGESVALAGDVNGDGISDVIAGTPGLAIGQVLIFHGSGAGLGAFPDSTLVGTQANEDFGVSLGTAGDVNGDKYSDIIVGASNHDGGEGRAYVWRGTGFGITGGADWTLENNMPNANFGQSVGTAGDVNGDGYADIIIGSPGYDSGGQPFEGAAYVYHGSASGPGAAEDWLYQSDLPGAGFGESVFTAGDVNGDGWSDVVIGADEYTGGEPAEGGVYVFFGAPADLKDITLAMSPELTADWSAQGNNQVNALFGYVNTAGDVNGDGYADVVVGGRMYDNPLADEGTVFVWHGSPTGLGGIPDWTYASGQAGAQLGLVVSTAGDVNGDGFSDLLAGALAYDNGEVDEGAVFLYYGSPGGLAAAPAWSVEGNQDGARLCSASSAGDVNGDGYSDVIVGSTSYDNPEIDEGIAYVFHGSASGLSATPSWTAEGNQASASFGSLGTAGDFNGDGYSDVIVSAPNHDVGALARAGRVYVYYGSPTGLDAAPAQIYEGDQAGALFGASVGSAGDVNGDGYSDAIAGAMWYETIAPFDVLAEGDGEGRIYVWYGSATGLGPAADWIMDGDSNNAQLGDSVSTAGDVNGDGYSDIIVGAHKYTNGQNQEGRAYLWLGSATGLIAPPDWFVESNDVDEFGRMGGRVASAGDVNGDGYSDVILGAIIYEDNFPIDENEGWAFLYYGNGGDGIDLVPRQRRFDDSAAVVAVCGSDAMDGFRLAASARTPYGRANVRLEWEVKPLWTPFDGTGLQQSAAWTDSGIADVTLNEQVTGLWSNVPHHWRVRFLYHPASVPYQQFSRWLSPAPPGSEETDVRTAPFSVIAKTPDDNDLDVAATANIQVTFDEIIDGASVTNDTFNVDGSISGRHACAFSGGGSDIIICDPGVDFVPGETVTVTLTRGIENPGRGILAVPVTWQFVVQAPAGFGNFLDSQSFGVSNTNDVKFGDFDGDGDLDAFTANWGNQANRVWTNDGAGNFTDSGQTLGTSNSVRVALGDIDGDGDMDAFVANEGQPNTVWTNNAGAFTLVQTLVASDSRGIVLGDVDGDGDLDAFEANSGGQGNRVWINDGTGFADSGQSLGNSDSLGAALGDFDGDGDLDAFVTNNGQPNRVWTNNGNGVFTDSGQALGGSNSWDVALGDLNNDGSPDAFVANWTGQADTVWLNNGAGVFALGQNLGTSNSWGVALGDLDADGDLDAYVSNRNEPDAVWLNNGTGIFATNGQSLGNSASIRTALGDIDGDGDLDAFVANESGQPNIVWRNRACPPTAIVYVDAGAAGGNTGDDWANACTDLQNALATAAACPGITEIRVARGTYTPGTNRTDTFQLLSGVAIYGGYPTGGGTPDWVANPTTLSGEIGTAGIADNTYNVVTGNGTDATAVLSGFTISGGNADGTLPLSQGGGMANTGSPTITNCVFSGNTSTGRGGGLYNTGNSAITDCEFVNNTTTTFADGFGGGIYNEGSPAITNCVFRGNFAQRNGGGISSFTGNPVITGCTFEANIGNNVGGGIHNNSGLMTVSGCMLTNNSANSGGGGGMFVGGTPAITNCTIIGNAGRQNGGGITFGGTGSITHCTIVNNMADSDDNGSGLGGGIRVGGTLDLRNCIVANNTRGPATDDDIDNAGTVTSDYNIVEFPNGYAGGGNDIGGPQASLNLGPLADNGGPTWTCALSVGSVAIEAGDPAFAAPPDFDQRGTGFPRAIDGDGDATPRIDIGAYEASPTFMEFSQAAYQVNENGTPVGVSVTVVRNASTDAASVDVQFTDVTATGGAPALVWPEDFNNTAQTVNFVIGATSVTVTVPVNDDAVDELNETLALALANPVNNAIGAQNTATLEIIDNDTAGITVGSPSGNTSESGVQAVFSVVLATQPVANVTIPISSSDTSEGAALQPSLTFAPSNWNVAQTVTVAGVDDAVADGNQNYTVTLSPAISTDSNYLGRDATDVNLMNTDDDSAGFAVSGISGNTSESGTQAVFTVVLISEPVADVTIPVSSSDASEGAVSPANLVFTASDWDTPRTVTATGVDDTISDGDQNYSILLLAAISTDTNYAGLDPSNVPAVNTDDDLAGLVVGAIGGDTGEDGTRAAFTVRLESQPDGNVRIDAASLNTAEGTAAPATLVFTDQNWNANQTVTVTGVDDAIPDGNRVYAVRLSVNAGGTTDTSGYAALAPIDVSVTNIDNDSPGVAVGEISGNTGEDGTSATFTVRLAAPPDGTAAISLASSNIAEGTVSPSSLIFTPSNWNADQTVTVTGVDDIALDGDQAYTIELAIDVSGTDDTTGYAAVDPPDVQVVNVDDESPGFAIGRISGDTSENGAQATFTVKLNAVPDGNVVIDLASSNPAEGTVFPASLTFTPANANANRTVTATGVDDALADGNQGYAILLTVNPATADGTGYALLDPPDVAVVNIDNESAGITITPEIGQTAEDGTQAVFAVRLNSPPDGNVVVSLSSSDPAEGVAVQPSLAFTPLNWNADQTVAVSGVDDDLADGDQWYALVLAIDPDLTADTTGYALIDPPDAAIVNLDDETPGFTVSPASGNTAEDGTGAVFTVRLNTEPYADVVVDVASSDPAEGVAAPSVLTFTPSDWNADQTVTVSGIDDDIADGDRAYTIALAVNAGNTSDIDYAALDPPDVAMTNIDNESPGFSVTPISGNTVEDGSLAAFSIRLNSRPDGDVVVSTASSDDSEGAIAPPVLVFTPANWNADQTVTATGLDDTIADGNQVYQAVLTIDSGATSDTTGYALLDPPDVEITNIDNETAGFMIGYITGNTAEDGTEAYFGLRLTSGPNGDVFVDAASSDRSEGVVSGEPLMFTPDNWNIWQTVTAAGVDDDLADGDRRYDVLLTINAAYTTDPAYAVLDPPDVSFVNIDDETAGFFISRITGDTAENGAQAEFSIRLNTEPVGNVVIDIASSDPGEGAVSPTTLTFTPSNWNTERTITAAGVDDAENDGDQAWQVILTVDSESMDGTYASLDPPDVPVVNIDDDSAAPEPVIVGQTELSTQEGEALTVTLEHFTVSDADSDYPTGFTISAEDGPNHAVQIAESEIEFTVIPISGFSGALTVPVRVSDGEYHSNVFQLNITVTPASATLFDPGLGMDGAGIPFEQDVGPSALCLFCKVEIDGDKIYRGISLTIRNTNPANGDVFMVNTDWDGDNDNTTGIHVDADGVVYYDGLRIGFFAEEGEDGTLEIEFDSDNADGEAVGELLNAVWFDYTTYPPNERPRDVVVTFSGDDPERYEYGMAVNFLYDRLCACHFEDGGAENAWPVALNPADESVIPDGSPVRLVASPYPDSGGVHKQTHWLVKRKGRRNWDYRHNSPPGLTEHTVTGLESGLKYVWKAGYENMNGDISWSPEQTFKIGPSAGEQVSVAPGVAPENFTMVSFTQWPGDPTFADTLGGIMGPELDRENYRIAAFDQTRGCFAEYGCERFRVEPGRAYWFMARTGLDMNVQGVPVSLGHDFELEMQFNPYDRGGWNMIAPPNDADYYWGDIQVVVYGDGTTAKRSADETLAERQIVFGPMPLSEMTFPNDIIDHRLWRLEGENYFPDTYRLRKNSGYLARVKRRDVSLIFPAGAGITPESVRPPDPGHDMTEPDDDVTPAFPFPTAVDEPCPEVESGEPGCFVKSTSRGK